MAQDNVRSFFSRYLIDEDFRKLADYHIDDALAEYDFDEETKNSIRTRDENLINLVFGSQIELPKESKKREGFATATLTCARLMFVKASSSLRVSSNLTALTGNRFQNEKKPSIFFRAAVPKTPEDWPDHVLKAAKAVQEASPDDRQAKLLELMSELVNDQ